MSKQLEKDISQFALVMQDGINFARVKKIPPLLVIGALSVLKSDLIANLQKHSEKK